MTNDKIQITNLGIIIKYLGLLLLAVFLMSGCAHTVTPRVNFGTEMVVEVTFRGNLDVNDNKYFTIVATSDSYELPYYPYEFLEPGLPAKDPTIDYWEYYRTWNSYIVLSNSANYFLVKGPFLSSSETYTQNNIGVSLTGVTSRMTYNVSLNDIFGTTIPPIIYFDVTAVDSTNILRDHLEPPSKYISSYSGSEIQGTDPVDVDISSDRDIISWKVYIQ